MNILKAIQKSLKIKPNIENLKKNRDVDGLIEAFSYYEPESGGNGLNDRLQRLAEIAIILGDLGDVRAIPIIEKVLKQLDERNIFWQDMIQSFGEQHALAGDNRAIYNMDMNVMRFLRPHVAQALKTLCQSPDGHRSDDWKCSHCGKWNTTRATSCAYCYTGKKSS